MTYLFSQNQPSYMLQRGLLDVQPPRIFFHDPPHAKRCEYCARRLRLSRLYEPPDLLAELAVPSRSDTTSDVSPSISPSDCTTPTTKTRRVSLVVNERVTGAPRREKRIARRIYLSSSAWTSLYPRTTSGPKLSRTLIIKDTSVRNTCGNNCFMTRIFVGRVTGMMRRG